jgi:hypothetical protein
MRRRIRATRLPELGERRGGSGRGRLRQQREVLDLRRLGEERADDRANSAKAGEPRKSTVWFSSVSQKIISR